MPWSKTERLGHSEQLQKILLYLQDEIVDYITTHYNTLLDAATLVQMHYITTKLRLTVELCNVHVSKMAVAS